MKRKPKTQAERSAASAEKRQLVGEEELRFRVRPGIMTMLFQLMQWAEFSQLVELIQTMIRNVHALGPEGARQFLQLPRHDVAISENLAQRLHREGLREAERLDRSEG
ncbi:hypothetical protein [Pseudomonas sp. DP-17]|uniref:hypothetical protein n=1 Tax=Pseudomonas sp. DP-17 TaxID=1580486 RepID=UPI001EFA6F5A|nr:hypothetical protein [Pseudomonas sp. DP-17]MCG8911267.1 hypothetical protein [Pseudomonas sp. DP-17]